MTEKNKVTKFIDHPLEDVFEIEKGSTEIEVYEREGELIPADSYDSKDEEIESQFEEVYNSAMDGHDLLAEEVQKVEGKYKARMGEVAVQHLNTALNAASQKARLKEHKDKLETSKKKAPTQVTNNTLIVDDRNALLEELRRGMEKQKQEDNE